ncbi:JAB domain-containing protein [Senegalia massiliensis]|uniref:RadC-like JAB domain-containing protein n=1 Tax=Senegalia massiliensis TaxID=1720316 RepID=A0A845QV45_9CLOT|nr:JAB domain-containing protein [Senegalia massiliensis]NBI06111.1 hypothetical protein [Senegalia massiliensis]
MYFEILILIVVIGLSVIFYEIFKLLYYMRPNKIAHYYYKYRRKKFNNDKELKKHMNPKGGFYTIDKKLSETPELVASLLKYKKHEWIVLAFVKNDRVECIWANKGKDSKSVGLILSFDNIVRLAKDNNYTSILMFHNHPNPNPNMYNCTQPSDRDLETVNEWSNICKKSEVNLTVYICERGVSYKY